LVVKKQSLFVLVSGTLSIHKEDPNHHLDKALLENLPQLKLQVLMHLIMLSQLKVDMEI